MVDSRSEKELLSRFRSLEGKTNKQGIRWSNNQFVWRKLKLKAIIDPLNTVTQHGLNAPIKLVRILWRELNGKRRWYVQLVCEGKPFIKPKNIVCDGMHRDLFSAYLSRFVEDNELSCADAQLE